MNKCKYESPIRIHYGDVKTKFDDAIFKAVQNVNIEVNREELIKALRYDRDQYQKGYEDATRWIPVSERLPEKDGEYLCTYPITEEYQTMKVLHFSNNLYKIDNFDFYKFRYKKKAGFYYYDSEYGYSYAYYVTAWQPLPEPYKESEEE